jgi:16S rRNA (guanine527-N7)-methyltransferase
MCVPRGTFGISEVEGGQASDVPKEKRLGGKGALGPEPPEGRGIPEHVAEALAVYADLVRRWSRTINLVSPDDLDRLESRHIADCLRAAPLVLAAPAGPALDVGAGAGLPGVVLAVAHPGRQWRLLEPNRRRVAFLEEAVRALSIDAEVLPLSAQQAARRSHLSGGHALATARAVAPPARAFSLLLPLVAAGGIAAVFVGERSVIPPEAEEWEPGIAIIRRVNR